MNDKDLMTHFGGKPAISKQFKQSAAVALIGLTAVGAACWLALHPLVAHTSESHANASAAMAVTKATARITDWPVQLEASGSVAAWQETVIGAQVSGVRLTELRVGPGDAVRKGQVLARFDTEALQAEVAQLRASLRQSEAKAAQAVANRDRSLKLKSSGSMSEQDLLQATTQAETTLAEIESSRAQLTLRQLQAQVRDCGCA